MNVDFVRFITPDGIELQGWFSDAGQDTAVIQIHGMSGNGYENHFLDNMRKAYTDFDISFFTFDNRGRGIISEFVISEDDKDKWGEGSKLGGSCFEIFEESVNDIQGAIDFLKTKGKTKFILQGHSLGCSKAVNYLQKENNEVVGAILLAPTDMVAWAGTDPNNDAYQEKARQLIAAGEPEELVSPECWLDKTPLSAQTYCSISMKGGAVDIYGWGHDQAPLSMLKLPALILYGTEDIGIDQADGDMDSWMSRAKQVLNTGTQIKVIEGAKHSFAGFEDQITALSLDFARQVLSKD